jgi:hypothetical protein
MFLNDNNLKDDVSKVFLPPYPYTSVGTPLLEKGGKISDL